MTWHLPRHPDGRPRKVTRAVRRFVKPTVGVVVPAYGVEEFLPAALDSLRAQTYPHWRAVVVDDGSPDRSGEIAEEYAARDRRITVLHTANGGLGAARNRGVAAVKGEYLAFLDSDDVLPPDAYAHMVERLDASGSDFLAASMLRVEPEPPAGRGAYVPEWLQRMHRDDATRIRIEDNPEILGDVFAVNKLWRRSFWESAGLRFPEGIRYEDQPTITKAYLNGFFDVTDHVVYHWLIRTDGSSITQQRNTLPDLVDRWRTKEWTAADVEAYWNNHVHDVFWERVAPGDLWQYLSQLPGCDDAWWDELHRGMSTIWRGRSFVGTILVSHERVVAWLVQQGRREDATALVELVLAHPDPLATLPHTADGEHLALPESVDQASVPDDVTRLHDWERRGVDA